MANRSTILPLAAMERLLRKGGATRVSDDAKQVLTEVLEEFADEIAVKANKIAQHAGRKTVKPEDVRLASE